MHSVHNMRPIAADGAAWSVCVSVRWSRSCALPKRLNRSRCLRKVFKVADSYGSKMGVNIRRIHSRPHPTSLRCGLLPYYFGHVLFDLSVFIDRPFLEGDLNFGFVLFIWVLWWSAKLSWIFVANVLLYSAGLIL